MSRPPAIVAVGGAHVDRCGRMAEAFVPGVTGPGTMREEIGGGAFNALRMAVRLGASGTLFSVRGGDDAGETVARAVMEAGIADRSAVFLDRATASHTTLLDSDDKLIAGLADMSLYEIAFPRQVRRSGLREAVAAADAVLCDGILTAVALRGLAEAAAGRPLYAIAFPPAGAGGMEGLLDRFHCMFMDRREAAALAGVSADEPPVRLVELLRQAGLQRAVVTGCADAVIAFDTDGAVSLVPPESPGIIGQPRTGEILAGAVVMGLLGGHPLAAALREGVAAAMLVPAAAPNVPAAARPLLAETLNRVPHAAPLE